MGFLNPNNWFAGQNDPTAASNMNVGKAVAPGDLAYQGVNPGSGQNSLDQYTRSLANLMGKSGQQILGGAQGYIDQGTNTVNQGLGTVGGGLGSTNASANYYQNLLSGNPAAMAQAIQPTANGIRAQYQGARNQLNTYAPMGGGRSNLMAQLPFQSAGAISNALAQVQPQAAQQLGSLGLGIGNLGLGIGGLGLNQQQFGAGQQQIGGNLLNSTLQNLLTGRGQDMAETGQNKALGGQLSGQVASLMPQFKF